MATPNDLQTQISGVQWTNGKGIITGAALLAILGGLPAIFYTMGTWDSTGTYTPSIPPGTITQAMLQAGVGGGGSAALVPQRVVGGSGAIPTSASDFLVCLTGPTEVDLEPSPQPGTTHVLKDCRGAAGPPIAVVPTGSTIDGLASYSMTVPAQSITVTFTSLGWSVY